MWRPFRGSSPTCWVTLLVAALCYGARSAAASDNNVFTIRHEKSNKCIRVKNHQLITGDCQETDESLWTWVSQHRLFNLGSQKCLGLEAAKSPNSLKMGACDSDLILWWRCDGDSIRSASQYKLALKHEIVTVSTDSSDTWKRNNSSDIICTFPYSEIYTRDGNAFGKPCEFPFLINNTWHHDCIHNEMFEGGEWCSTTSYFNQDKKWGFCLKPEDGCQNTWEHNADSGHCYQLNTQAALSWKEAYLSCKKQGGDLLSISSASELQYFQAKEGIAEIFWIGLNQLGTSGGWQWSDNTPLIFLNWNSEMQDLSPLEGNNCVAMIAETGDWESFSCDTALPYVCKKQINDTQLEFSGIQNDVEVRCEFDWYPHNGFCYRLMNSTASWKDAHLSCNESNSNLISIHALGDVELVVTKLHNETKDKVWIGLKNEDIPTLFKWSDGSKVVFTYWDQDEPKVSFRRLPSCVAYSGKFGQWRISPCNEQLKYVCMKKGKVLDEPKSDKECSLKEEWKKHGDYCYKIDKNVVSFGHVCNLTIANRFEQEFINNFIRMHIKFDERRYFWTGLQDINSSGEYRWGSADGRNEVLTYTNWGPFQPEFRGGCVAMSNGGLFGKWEVKDCQTFKAYSICKKYIGPKRKPEIQPKVTDSCPQGWHRGSGLACYKFFHKERVLRTRTWEEAEKFCEALGGHLPSFSHSEEIRELHIILSEIISDDRWIWIGLNKRNPKSLGSWEWSDDRPISTVVMTPEFREDGYEARDCASVKILVKSRPMWSVFFLGDREDFYLKPFHCGAKLEWVCQITKGSIPKIPEWYKPDEEGIDGPVVNIDGSEFWFVPNKTLSYQEASLYCSKSGSDLAYVSSFTELNGILNKIVELLGENQNWWLKYRDPPAYRYRSPFLSYNHEQYSRNCWHISYTYWFRGNILSCSTKLPFICERYNVSLLETSDPHNKPPQGSCPENWVSFLNKCYRKVTPRNMTFKKANEYCQSLGGFLPSIKSQTEQDFITSLLPNMPSNIWIGLCFHMKTHANKWADGSELDYVNFHPLLQGTLRKVQLNLFNEEANNQCGVLLNNPKTLYVGTWNFTSCADTLSLAICEKHPDAVENQTVPSSESTMEYLNVTYTLILKNLTWSDAQQECLKKNMQLVSITEQYQQAFLASKAALHNHKLWIGLSSKDDGIHYQWSDRKHISFSHWSEEDEDLVDDCVYLDSNGFWKTSECYAENQGAICYLPGNETEKYEEQYEAVKCPHKIKNTPWIAFRNSCYTFMIPKTRWKGLRSLEGHHLCRTMNSNASLLNIRDEDENDFVIEQLQSFRGLAQWMWLGLMYDTKDNLLKWYDDTLLSYNNWRMGRPDVKNNDFLAGINLDGFWDIYNYTNNTLFHWQFSLHSILVCKIEMDSKEKKVPLGKMLPYRNNMYWILQKQLSWYEAWKECKRKGSDLASVHSLSEQLFLEEIVRSDGFSLWIGLSNNNGNNSDFEWSDGSTLDYQPWEFQHSPSHSAGNCVSLDTKGSWNHIKCTYQGDGAICYFSSTKMQSKQTEMSPNCPKPPTGSSRWIHYKDHCYAFDMAFYNYSAFTIDVAKKVCKKLDPSADLLTIKDAEENKFVSTHLKENYFITGKVWLGTQSDAQSLTWLDGSEIKYANWVNGSKKAEGGCSVVFATNGTWSKTDCKSEPSRVVCKAPQVNSHSRGAIAVAVVMTVALVVGLIYFLYKKKQLHWDGFSSVRYQRGMQDDETDSMFARDGD